MAKIDNITMEKLIAADYNKADIKKMSDKQIEDIIKQIDDVEDLLGGAIEINDTSLPPDAIEKVMQEQKEIEIESRPKITDPAWTDYVLGLLTKDELSDGSPKCDGLRRVCTLLLGDFSTYTDIVQAPNIMNNYHAVITTKLVFKDGTTVTGSADVSGYNTSKEYAIHPVASCETRSESRAIRRALKLVKVIAAEEKIIGEPAESDSTEDKPITQSMVASLISIARRINVDPIKVANKLGYIITDLNDLTKTQALSVGKKLSHFSTSDAVITPDVTV